VHDDTIALTPPEQQEGETRGRGPLPHLPALDGMRGIAVIAVVFYHFAPRSTLHGVFQIAGIGWIGVDFFFVLSGFLITSILLRQQCHPKAILKFYIRRALRLFPLYYFLVLIVLISIPILHLSWSRAQFGFLVYAANYVLIFVPDAYHIGPFFMIHTWSLAVEEQFYLLWPWLVLPGRLTRRSLLTICFAIIVVSPLLRTVLWYHGAHEPLLQMSLFTRLDSLLVGAALALTELPSRRNGNHLFAGSLMGLALCAFLSRSLSLRDAPMNTFGLTATALLAAGFLSLALTPHTLPHRLCSLRITRFFGRYSYGIYLWHVFLSALFIRWATTLTRVLALPSGPASLGNLCTSSESTG
jgi:peptidoglycan/LPS O-acetylase OafA/YrhL